MSSKVGMIASYEGKRGKVIEEFIWDQEVAYKILFDKPFVGIYGDSRKYLYLYDSEVVWEKGEEIVI
jgi:hypothetical protein